jgi:hypothetical protein
MKESVLRVLIEALTSSGFRPYLTSIGGSGLGVLSPHDPANYAVASSNPDQPPSLREAFEGKRIDELAGWAEQRGRWLYI